MRFDLSYFFWYLNQVGNLVRAIIKTREKSLIFKNVFKLFAQEADIVISFDSRFKFIIRDFYDLLGLYEVFCNNSYSKLFSRYNGPKVSFIDIGAYIGDSSVYASKYKYIKDIVSIEPQLSNFKVLSRNLAMNKIKSKLLNLAVANTKEVVMYEYKNRRQTGINKNGIKRKRFKIEAISLEKLINQNKGEIFVKCDTEGAEFDVFLNTPIKTINKIGRVMIEYHSLNRLNLLADRLMESGLTVEIVANKHLQGLGYIYAYTQ